MPKLSEFDTTSNSFAMPWVTATATGVLPITAEG